VPAGWATPLVAGSGRPDGALTAPPSDVVPPLPPVPVELLPELPQPAPPTAESRTNAIATADKRAFMCGHHAPHPAPASLHQWPSALICGVAQAAPRNGAPEVPPT